MNLLTAHPPVTFLTDFSEFVLLLGVGVGLMVLAVATVVWLIGPPPTDKEW